MTREETKKRFQSWCQEYIGNNASDEDYQMFNNIMALLEQEPKTGHWIDGVCSECGYIGDEEVFGGKFKYCPVCGAVMRGEHGND